MDDEASWRRLGAQVLWYRRDNLASNLKLLAVSQLVRNRTRPSAAASMPAAQLHLCSLRARTPPSLHARVWQLLSGTYAVGPRSLHCGGFGVLCGCGALIGLAAAHSCSRPLLYLVRRSPHRPPPLTPRPPPRAPLSVGGLHVALTALTLALALTLPQHACTSLVTAGGAAQLLRKISRLLSSDLAERLLSSGATVHGLLSLRAAPGAMLGQHHGTHSSHRLLLGLGGVTVLVCLVAVRPASYHPIARYIPPTVLVCLVTYMVTFGFRCWRR